MTRYRTEADEIAHLEPPMPSLGLFPSSGTGQAMSGPLHRWKSIVMGECCSRCGLRRWPFGEGYLYQLAKRAGLRAGGEPRCARKS